MIDLVIADVGKAMDGESSLDGLAGGSRLEPSAAWTVSQLRDYLKEKGGRPSGRKSELVER